VETELLPAIDEVPPTTPAAEDTAEATEDILMAEALDATLGALLETASEDEPEPTEERMEAIEETPTTDDEPALKAEEAGWLAEETIEMPDETG